MSTSAILMMVTVMTTVTAITGYFLYKVLTIPPKPENEDSEEIGE